MPVSLLIALFLAYGIDVPAGPGPIARPDLIGRLGEALGGVALVGALAFGLGRLVAARVSRRGYASSALRRRYSWGVRVIEVLTLGVYAGILYGAGWPIVVRSGFGLGDTILLDDLLILLPYFLAQLLGWWGLYAAERALRPSSRYGSGQVANLGRFLTLKVRQSLGLVLPGLLVFSLGQDLARQQWPDWAGGGWAPLAGMAFMGLLVLVLSPLFVRLAWPTHPLPPGPLRDRLEHLAKRYGFRCTDILVWDTGHVLVNAGVTGALPWFRYVLLTDALIENLNPLEVAAVFGHEIGHIAHRHLFYLGFFSVGSLGVMALLLKVIDAYLMPIPPLLLPIARGDSTLVSILQSALGLLSLGALLPAGLRSRLAAVRAAGRRVWLPDGLVRTLRLSAAHRSRQPLRRNSRHGPALPGGNPDLRQRAGQRCRTQRNGAWDALVAPWEHQVADWIPRGS